jgi:hypothetical protein
MSISVEFEVGNFVGLGVIFEGILVVSLFFKVFYSLVDNGYQ